MAQDQRIGVLLWIIRTITQKYKGSQFNIDNLTNLILKVVLQVVVQDILVMPFL